MDEYLYTINQKQEDLKKIAACELKLNRSNVCDLSLDLRNEIKNEIVDQEKNLLKCGCTKKGCKINCRWKTNGQICNNTCKCFDLKCFNVRIE